MPESLTLRTLQLPVSGNEAGVAAGLTGNGDAGLDFQAVLAQQLGGSASEAITFGRSDAAADSDTAEQEADDRHAIAADPAALALQVAVPHVSAPSAGAANPARAVRTAPADGAVESAVIEEAPNGRSAGALPSGTESTLARAADVARHDSRFTWELGGERQSGDRRSGEVPATASPQAELSLHNALERKPESFAPPAQAAAAHPLDEPVAFGRRAFANDLGERVLWMASNNRQVAELRVDPPHLGPVEVRLSIEGEQASVTLIAAHAGVREALQSSIPRLQDMIHAIGLELGNVTVGGETHPGHQEQTGDRSQRHGPERHEAEHPLAASGPRAWAPRHAGVGLVDTYA